MPNPYRILALAFIVAISVGGATMLQPGIPAPNPDEAPTVGVLYAAPVERVETHVLSSGQTLSGVLSQARITGQEMADLLLGMRQHLNPGRLSTNTEITVRRWLRSDEPRAIEVRLNRDSTVRLVKQQTRWDGEVVITPTVVDTVYASGEIQRTLYEAIVFDESSQLPVPDRRGLVAELAGVYEYKLDFTREIQPGDSYRMVYEREVRPDGSARSRKILAAEMNVRGHSYKGFWFDHDQARGYYDEEARPLAHGFSRYPVEFVRITSNFNPNRYHPILKTVRAHTGTDFGAPTGTPVMSTAEGTVVFAGVNGGYGNLVEIRHFNGYITRYAHLSRFASGIRVGTRVSQKQVIGYVGATGLATAPHLHYELRVNGRAVDARTARLPDAPPIPGAIRGEFLAVAAERSTLLERIPYGVQFARSRQDAAGRTGDDL
ncbi:MAG TPA: peptidoglycan DD-metalloendopeptidase family protein [Longimicrobiales bacterium]|nr:peptidoglycan DD-metalloendopeptidase family protein [Longimicrobiales bacterium]